MISLIIKETQTAFWKAEHTFFSIAMERDSYTRSYVIRISPYNSLIDLLKLNLAYSQKQTPTRGIVL